MSYVLLHSLDRFTLLSQPDPARFFQNLSLTVGTQGVQGRQCLL
jgi:hypothetical protein